ncbi:MAG: SusC/RagA family TonB-linked outer membrane protein, partial [Bacteroidota bacterium]
MKNQLLIFFILCCAHHAFCQTLMEGHVVSQTDSQPLPGVNVVVKGTTRGTTTDSNGVFTIMASDKDVLVFSFIGYAPQEVVVGNQSVIKVQLAEDIATLDEVTIVSTGYEQLPKERATGSFAKVDQELVNRRVSTDIMSRLEDVTSGLIFNRNVEGRANDISIRGRSTLFANASPLIVIDNFPYEGDINTINPNDVESITVLKDAAAASIWGARAGNGVIVITTKKGKANQAPQISVNANVTVIDKPDLFYVPRMSSSDFVDLEQVLFSRGVYTATEASASKAPLTPAVEAMIANRDGMLSDHNLDVALDEYRSYDVRNDYEKYFYRNAINQQYSIGVSGGSTVHRYTVSTGFDRNQENLIGNDFSRFTFNTNNTWSMLHDKLEFGTTLYYTQSKYQNNNAGPASIRFTSISPLYPYARLKDDAGNNLPVTVEYRNSFVTDAESNGLLNWQYNPLDEISQADNQSRLTDYRINANLKYAITPNLHAEVLYQYWNSASSNNNHRSKDTYFARNLVNLFTQKDAFGTFTYPVPMGGVLDVYERSSVGHNFRSQLRYGKTWSEHALSALAGYEVREVESDETNFRYYGYDGETAASVPVNYSGYFPYYYNAAYMGPIPNVDYVRSFTDRFISFYGNAAYTFLSRYTFSASARKDQSNLFGVETNQKGVPLWSTGLSWITSNEGFYQSSWLQYLKVRTTIGYNGNIDKSLTAYTTAYNIGTYWLT